MVENNKSFIIDLRSLYKDITDIKINPKDSYQDNIDKFYEVMRKWGICQGELDDDGNRLLATAEWNVCHMIFEKHLNGQFMWATLLSKPPKDLLAYKK